jgi:signal recognition particle subunit SRP54
MVIKIIHDEIVNVLSSPPEISKLNLHSNPPINILMVGLQGSGKTTASAKIALRLKNQNKKVLLTSLDTYRPAAQEQLARLAESIEVDCLPIIAGEKPIAITKRSLSEAKLAAYDVVIYDTAGRLHIDDEMLSEVAAIKDLVIPSEVLLVVDAMIGQDAVNVASNFDKKLSITGVVLSRIDGDTRGGATLSIKHVTNKPIKFLSNGERLSDLEEFSPERIASRILDMGDIVSFVEKATSVINQQESESTAARLQKGQFDLNDYLVQIRSINKLGGFSSVLGMLPGVSKFASQISQNKLNAKLLQHQEAIILSMTIKERKNPNILNAARRKRIADGSGTSVQKVNILLKQFRQISDLMKKTSKMDPKQLMRSGLGKIFS